MTWCCDACRSRIAREVAMDAKTPTIAATAAAASSHLVCGERLSFDCSVMKACSGSEERRPTPVLDVGRAAAGGPQGIKSPERALCKPQLATGSHPGCASRSASGPLEGPYSAPGAQGYRTHGASRASAQADTRRDRPATGRSPTKTSLVSRSLDCSPRADTAAGNPSCKAGITVTPSIIRWHSV
jgi:hypothetical protein